MKVYLCCNLSGEAGDIMAVGRADTLAAAKEAAIQSFCKDFQERPESVAQDLMDEYLVWVGPYA